MFQFYVYDPEGGIELFESAEAAQAAAGVILDECRSNASEDGWPEHITEIQWGRLEATEKAVMVDKRPAPRGSGFDYLCGYEFRRTADED